MISFFCDFVFVDLSVLLKWLKLSTPKLVKYTAWQLIGVHFSLRSVQKVKTRDHGVIRCTADANLQVHMIAHFCSCYCAVDIVCMGD